MKEGRERGDWLDKGNQFLSMHPVEVAIGISKKSQLSSSPFSLFLTERHFSIII